MRYAYFEGKVVPVDQAKISVMTHAFLYGTACFEGIRGYWVPDTGETLLFRMQDHYARILQSCKILQIEPRLSIDELCRVTCEVVQRNEDQEDIYVRPVFYKSELGVGVRLNGLQDDFVLFSVPFGPYLDIEKGLQVCVSSWRHIEDNMIPMRAKVNGAYVNAALAKTEALQNGYDEAIVLDATGHVSEGSAANLFIVREGCLVTPPVTADILEGVTRATIIQLAREEMNLDVKERLIDRTELYVAEEAFFVGTGAQMSPITGIDRRRIGTGQIGPISRRLQSLYMDVVRGKLPRYRAWCHAVPIQNASTAYEPGSTRSATSRRGAS